MIANTNLKQAAKIGIGLAIFVQSVIFIYDTGKFYALTPEALGKYYDIWWVLIAHIAGGALALAAGPFLIWRRVREKASGCTVTWVAPMLFRCLPQEPRHCTYRSRQAYRSTGCTASHWSCWAPSGL